jgi:hypothetical protein
MRKNIWVLALLLYGLFSLAAQSRTGASIYVTPVSGIGSAPEDNSLFYRQLVFELTDQNYNLARIQDGADFSLIGVVAPRSGEQYVFYLALRDHKAGEIMVEGELLYETPEDINHLFPVMVTNLLYTIPERTLTEITVPERTVPEPEKEETVKNGDWRDKWLYVGAAAFLAPRVYIGSNSSDGSTYFGYPRGALSFEWHFLDFMSFEAGAELAADSVATNRKPDGYQNTMIEIPLLVKYVIKPGVLFMLEPYVGVQINKPIYDTTRPPPFSGLAGFQYGVKAGPGAFFMDARLIMDIGKSAVQEAPGRDTPYQRYIIHLGMGYKYGVFSRYKN